MTKQKRAALDAQKPLPRNGYFKVIVKTATPVKFFNKVLKPFYVRLIGKTIMVKKTRCDKDYFITSTGRNILKADVERLVPEPKKRKTKKLKQ